MLLVADTHFGKDSIFRSRGIAIPTGSSEDDFRKLSTLIAETQAERLVILGDFLHGPLASVDPFWSLFDRWQQNHTQLTIQIIIGNHDRHALRSDNPHLKCIDWLPTLAAEPFLFTHEPTTDPEHYVLSGHIHPTYRLTDNRSDTMRLPVFVFGEHSAILPAFGAFTGGYNIRATAKDRLYVVGDDAVMALTR